MQAFHLLRAKNSLEDKYLVNIPWKRVKFISFYADTLSNATTTQRYGMVDLQLAFSDELAVDVVANCR